MPQLALRRLIVPHTSIPLLMGALASPRFPGQILATMVSRLLHAGRCVNWKATPTQLDRENRAMTEALFMINLRDVGPDALWIVGLTVLLATLSYTDWWVRRRTIHWRQAACTPLFLAPSALGLSLVTVALCLKAHHVLERTFWAAWSVLLVAQSILTLARLTKR
jgi:hypothetical protein